MSAVPPLPPGFEVERNPDPWTILRADGFVATNGFRTDADVEDIRRQGYSPAERGAHNRGDGVDLTHPKLNRRQQTIRLRELARKHGWKEAVVIDEGHHRHLAIPGWGAAPGTPGTANSGLPAIPSGFEVEKRGSLSGGNFAAPDGVAHDGDTFKLSTGENARLLGADAYELKQQGRRSTGALEALGIRAREFMQSRVPGLRFNPTGRKSFGRPEGSFGDENNDPAEALLRHGYGLAAPEYLEGDPRFSEYMEAERLARLNLLGGHGTNAETPEQFRNKDGPWQGAEPGQWGEGEAIFGDDRTPFMGLRPEIEQAYIALFSDPNSTADDLLGFAEEHGFRIRREDAEKAVSARNKGAGVTPEVIYERLPMPTIDPGDGTVGAAARGLADPINFIDELGGIADTLGIPSPGAGGPRETIWNSDRRFGDVLWNNIDQNRAVLAHDDEHHYYARLGGQLLSGISIPVVGVEGVGIRAAAKVLAEGGGEALAEQAARRAVSKRLAVVGGAEGGAIGAGAAEGDPLERLPNAAAGAGIGAVATPVVGKLIERGAALYRRGRNALRQATGRSAEEAAEPQSSVAAMRMEDDSPELVGPVVREPDYIRIAPDDDLPPIPDGFVLDEPFGATRPTTERLSPEQMARLAEDVEPESVLPRPANMIEDLSEAATANPGRFVELESPDEFKHLPVRTLTTKTGGKVRVRGPLDLTQSLRHMGGIKDPDGELAHLGITNEPRRMDFGSNEQFLGKLIDNESGLDPDEAMLRLWEEGYFPEFDERPHFHELFDRLKLEQMGERRFHPDEWDEVANFDAVRDERYRFDQARDEGAPLVEERGHSINLDDLVENTPPVSAYEDAPRLTGKIGNINLDRLEKPEEVSQLIDQISKRVGGFDAAARGRVTHEETRRLAQEMGLKPEQLLKRRQGQALNAEQAYAARALVQRSRETVAQLARRAVGGDDAEKLAFRKAWLKHVALEEQIAGATAEAGRLLSQFRMAARASDAGADAVRGYLKAGKGKDSLEDAAEAIVDLMEDPAKASHFMREAVKPRWRDKFNELWINSLLSGPRTHVVNFVGNSLTTALSFPELAVTAGLGKLTRSADRAMFREVGARAVGMADSSVEALRRMKTAFRTGEPIDAVTKVEAAHHRAIGGKLGHVLRAPTRALTASDEFWKHILASGALRQMAYRKAAGEAKEADDLRARYQELVRNPTDDMVKRAQGSARYFTFQQPLGDAGQGVQRFSNNWVGGKLLLPFVRTPINILKFAGERSAFGLAMPEVRAALKAGGRQRDEALAKILLGSGLSTAAVVATMDGRITGGGPSDPRERAAWLEVNQPYSIRVGDQWVSYQRFDPVSTLFGVAADFAEIGTWASEREADAIALDLAMSIAKNITSKTWLSGLSDAFDVLSDPERHGRYYFQRLAGSVAVPSLVNQASQSMDPHLRDARTIIDGIKARVPVLSKSVPVRRDVWGEPIERGDAIGPDILSPFYGKQASNDPVKREMARLRAPLSKPQRTMFVDGNRVRLTPEQYDSLLQLSGKAAKSYLDQFIKSPEWRGLTDDERREEVDSVLKDFRSAAREELKRLYPELGSATAAPLPPGFAPEEAATDSDLPALPPGFELAQ